jgi:hypothetical protein
MKLVAARDNAHIPGIKRASAVRRDDLPAAIEVQ